MSTSALLLDYLFARELIALRLRNTVPELAPEGAVIGIEKFTQAIERTVTAPTAFVLWEGDKFGNGPGELSLAGSAQIVRQQWAVLLAVRNADQVEGDARNASAGPLLAAIHKALAGFVPTGCARPLRRVQGRGATYTPNVGLFPLSFELPLHL